MTIARYIKRYNNFAAPLTYRYIGVPLKNLQKSRQSLGSKLTLISRIGIVSYCDPVDLQKNLNQDVKRENNNKKETRDVS